MADRALFPFEDAGDYGRIRDTLAAAGYDDRGVTEALGAGLSSLLGKKLAVLLHRTSGGTPLETLIRLFILGVRVGQGPAQAALGPMGPQWWAERGLASLVGDEVEATVHLRCYQGLVVAFDFLRRGGAALSPEYVMGISASFLTPGRPHRPPAQPVDPRPRHRFRPSLPRGTVTGWSRPTATRERWRSRRSTLA